MKTYWCKCRHHTQAQVRDHEKVIGDMIEEIVKMNFYRRMERLSKELALKNKKGELI